jgi:Leucine-rich repeat (LRR) protein
MAKGKKGKKGKKGADKPIIPPVTTVKMIEDRTKMLCPRMGDVYTRAMQVDHILEDVATHMIKKVAKKQLTALSLCSMRMSDFPELKLILPDLQCLREVNLSKNNLFNGDRLFEALCQLEQLTKLDLSENALNGQLSDFAGNLNLLESINLDVNQLTGLGSSVSNWSKLKKFSAQDNSLSEIPDEAVSWKEAQHINFKNNKIATLPGKLLNAWQKLERLYMGTNLLTEIPVELGSCTCIVELDFSSNQIESVPVNIALCEKLELLHLGNNQILDVPPEIFSALTNLRELQLYKNKLTILPPEIGNLRSIERLSVASNNIKTVPEEIGSCVTLVELYLSNNAKLSYFPSSAGHLRRLQELKLYKCPALKQLPTTALEMTSLKELDLRAVKKQVCKISPECMEAFKAQKCIVRGGVVKKIKGDLKPPASEVPIPADAGGESGEPFSGAA